METTDPRGIAGVLRLVFALLLLLAFSYGADWLLRAENFPVRNLYFEGPFKRVAHAELEAAVLDTVRGNFFLIDLNLVQRRLEAVPWIHKASVRRRFPQDIDIQFTEQALAARWSTDAWVNSSGEVVRLAGPDLPAGLPTLDGPEGTAVYVLSTYQAFVALLTDLDVQVASLRLTPRRSWQLELKTTGATTSIALVLDDDQPRARFERFVRAYGPTLAAQAAAIKQIDLRYTNGFAVEWRNGRPSGARVAVSEMRRNEGG